MGYKKITILTVLILFLYIIELTIAFFNPIQNKNITYKESLISGFNNTLYVKGDYDLFDDSNDYIWYKENGYRIYKINNSSYFYNEELYPDAKIIEEDGMQYFFLHDDLYIETKREAKKMANPFTFFETVYIDWYQKEVIPKYDYSILITKDELNNNDLLDIKSINFYGGSLVVEKCLENSNIKKFNSIV